jgi:L-glyceraldehyde 3-phosphate reductase
VAFHLASVSWCCIFTTSQLRRTDEMKKRNGETLMYLAHPDRYNSMSYQRTGRSGLKLPAISLGLWHNFGGVNTTETARAMLRRAFDLGITHFDLANNYGPPPGSAEETFGRIHAQDFRPYRDELIISTKAGYGMFPGPYGDWGSRKYLIASLDQSLKRMGLDYVDIFYHHRPDPETPLEETMGALDAIVRSGRALYVGISNYSGEQTREAARLLRALGTPCLIHQPSYSMLNRWVEQDLLHVLREEGIGSIVFSPLQQGLLTDKYLRDIPEDSRVATSGVFLRPEHVTEAVLQKTRALNELAAERGQTLAQMALSWVLRHPEVTSALIGASRPEQIEDAVGALRNRDFSAGELARIDTVLQKNSGS